MPRHDAPAAVAPAALAALLAACAVEQDILNSAERQVTEAGATQVVQRDEFDRFSLAVVVAEHTIPPNTPALPGKCKPPEKKALAPQEVADTAAELNAAIARFYRCGGLDDDGNRVADNVASHRLTLKRNRIQDRILATADRRCEIYKTYLTRAESNETFLFGTLTTVLGGLGAILTPQNTVRSLAGAAGISSGVDAEFHRAYFKNQVVGVVFSGIDMRRSDIHSEIAERRTNPIEGYTLEHAIKDAIQYNGACSMIDGLRHVQDKVAAAGRGVGLDEALSTMDKVGRFRLASKLAELADDPAKESEYEGLLRRKEKIERREAQISAERTSYLIGDPTITDEDRSFLLRAIAGLANTDLFLLDSVDRRSPRRDTGRPEQEQTQLAQDIRNQYLDEVVVSPAHRVRTMYLVVRGLFPDKLKARPATLGDRTTNRFSRFVTDLTHDEQRARLVGLFSALAPDDLIRLSAADKGPGSSDAGKLGETDKKALTDKIRRGYLDTVLGGPDANTMVRLYVLARGLFPERLSNVPDGPLAAKPATPGAESETIGPRSLPSVAPLSESASSPTFPADNAPETR